MLYVCMFIIGAQPSHSIVNTNPAELASHVGYQVFQVPETTDADTDNEALSKTIQKLRRDLVVENLKNAKLEEHNQDLIKQRESYKALLTKKDKRIAKLTAKKVSKVEKQNIVKEVLGETKFTEV